MSNPYHHQIAGLILQVLNRRADDYISYVKPWKSRCLDEERSFGAPIIRSR